jgi:hypothetical protein
MRKAKLNFVKKNSASPEGPVNYFVKKNSASPESQPLLSPEAIITQSLK